MNLPEESELCERKIDERCLWDRRQTGWLFGYGIDERIAPADDRLFFSMLMSLSGPA